MAVVATQVPRQIIIWSRCSMLTGCPNSILQLHSRKMAGQEALHLQHLPLSGSRMRQTRAAKLR